jgi:hypothetical protein
MIYQKVVRDTEAARRGVVPPVAQRSRSARAHTADAKLRSTAKSKTPIARGANDTAAIRRANRYR